MTEFYDIHCHFLPGVDDGVQKMEESLAILNEYEQLGVHAVWCTPHVMEDIPNTTQKLRARFEELKSAYKGQVELRLAAEYMIDDLFMERLEAGDVLPHGEGGTHLLVETSYFNPPSHFEQTLNLIKSKGYFPILAHPERYMYMHDAATYKRLKQNAVRFQLNLGSLGEAYGRTAKHKAEMLLKEGYYDFVGTDIHSIDLLPLILSTKRPVELK